MNASSSRSHAIFTIHVQQRRLVPAASASPAPSEDSSTALHRKDSSHSAREGDQVEELVEAHMVFVDLAGKRFWSRLVVEVEVEVLLPCVPVRALLQLPWFS